MLPTKRSAIALARGACTGVRMMRMSIAVKTASKAAVTLASRSRMRNRKAAAGVRRQRRRRLRPVVPRKHQTSAGAAMTAPTGGGIRSMPCLPTAAVPSPTWAGADCGGGSRRLPLGVGPRYRSGPDGRVLCRCTTHYGLPLPPVSPLAGSGPR
jgi:hypothetical protein